MESPTTRTESGEEFESIPWDSLLEDDSRRTRRRVGLAAMAIVALALSAGAARTLWTRPTPPVVLEQAVTSTTSAIDSTTGALPTSSTSRPNPDVSPAPPPAEADLMAVDVVSLEGTAAAYAAIWLTDAFTATGPPHSFVEDVRPLESRDLGDGRIAVVLAFRTLEDAGGGYERMPLRTAEVVVDMTGERPVVVDLPAPVPAPPLSLAAVQVESAEAPAAVIDAALAAAEEWGTAEAVRAGRLGDAWRVELSVTDGAGLVWPVSVWVDEAGTPLPAGG